jgi:hypothetical protein
MAGKGGAEWEARKKQYDYAAVRLLGLVCERIAHVSLRPDQLHGPLLQACLLHYHSHATARMAILHC